MEDCPPVINDCSIGIPYGDFDGKITASSEYDQYYSVKCCKLNKIMSSPYKSAWEPKDADKEKCWIQVNFGFDLLITSVSIQGRGDANYFVTKFRILYSTNGKDFINLEEFKGNSDNTSVVKRIFHRPVLAKAIRLQVLEFYGDYPALRFDLGHIPLPNVIKQAY